MLAPGPAKFQLPSIFEDDNVISVEVRMQFLDPIEIHDDRSMYPHKLRRIEPLLEIVHLLAKQMRLTRNMQLRLIPVCFNEVDLINLQQHHPA